MDTGKSLGNLGGDNQRQSDETFVNEHVQIGKVILEMGIKKLVGGSIIHYQFWHFLIDKMWKFNICNYV